MRNDYGLPIPLPLPDVMVKTNDAGTQALRAKIETLWRQVAQELVGMLALRRPDQCASAVLDELAATFAAPTIPGMSDIEKRRVIATAVRGHIDRGQWLADAKLKIDAIAGGTATIFGGITEVAWWIAIRGNEPASNNWATVGDGSITDYTQGLYLPSGGDEEIIQGNIRINVDNATLTAQEVQTLVDTLRPIAPAYYRLILGYVAAGQFIEYAGGRIE